MSKSFRLNDIERKTLMQMNDISEINEYGWKNLNILRLKPSKDYQVGDSEISFQLDSSLLASNVPLNRVQMEIDYEVVASMDTSVSGKGLAGPPVYNWALSDPSITAVFPQYPWVMPANTEYDKIQELNNTSFSSYLTSPSNGGLDFLVGNKSFSNVKVKNGSNELRDDKRSFERIDIMSRMLDESKMIKEGIYPDYEKGAYLNKAGGDVELMPLYFQAFQGTYAPVPPPDPSGYMAYSNLYAKGCSPTETQEKNLFWKRNTNKQYIIYGDTQFRKTTTGEWVNGLAPPASEGDAPTDVISAITPIREIYEYNPFQQEVEKYWYYIVPDSSYFNEKELAQKTEMTVFEDLLGDIFTTVYNRHENFRPLPASQLNFTFTISPLINNLYKTSNGLIKNVEVNITKMRLNIFTFNYGLLNIEPSTYYVPYYQEKSDVQAVILDKEETVVSDQTIAEIQTLKYNKMPNYVLIYAQEALENTASGNQYQNLRTVDIKNLQLEINNDQGTALYSLTIKELKEMTIKNLGKEFSNYSSMWRTNSANICSGLTETVLAWENSPFPYVASTATYYYMSPDVLRRMTNTMGTMWSQSFLDGVYMLKIGEDIRIEQSMLPSLNRPVSMNWKITFGTGFTGVAPQSPPRIAFNSIAFFPAYYMMNPQTGLIKSQDITINDEDFWAMLRNTNEELESIKNRPQNVTYSSEYPQMMLGSGWFSGLWSGIKKALPVISNVANTVNTVSGVASQLTGNPKLKQLHEMSGKVKTGTDLLGSLNAGKTKKLRKKKH